jgi:hypothetical protein
MYTNSITNNASLILIAYGVYLPIALVLTFWTSKMLFKNGKVFMLDIFNGNDSLASSTNKLFEVGYFLMNLGFALLILEISYIDSKQMLVERLSTKIGGFTIWLGIVFMINVVLFIRGRKNANRPRTEIKETMIAK